LFYRSTLKKRLKRVVHPAGGSPSPVGLDMQMATVTAPAAMPSTSVGGTVSAIGRGAKTRYEST
jgi:hypothetical protein